MLCVAYSSHAAHWVCSWPLPNNSPLDQQYEPCCCPPLLLTSAPTCVPAGLEHLLVCKFLDIREPRASLPCSWRSLKLFEGDFDVQTLAHLPLHSLTQVRPVPACMLFTL